MSKLTIALVSIVGTLGIILLYHYVFNPQIVSSPNKNTASKCPQNWIFADGLCKPSYPTNCSPFDPSKITSAAAGCNIARSCGTTWDGMCA